MQNQNEKLEQKSCQVIPTARLVAVVLFQNLRKIASQYVRFKVIIHQPEVQRTVFEDVLQTASAESLIGEECDWMAAIQISLRLILRYLRGSTVVAQRLMAA
jgi:hypothetical protein